MLIETLAHSGKNVSRSGSLLPWRNEFIPNVVKHDRNVFSKVGNITIWHHQTS